MNTLVKPSSAIAETGFNIHANERAFKTLECINKIISHFVLLIGIEPTRRLSHKILSLAWLPITPQEHFVDNFCPQLFS